MELQFVTDDARIPSGVELVSCATCGQRDVTPRCSACGVMRYCNTGCQEADWARHKPICIEFRRRVRIEANLTAEPDWADAVARRCSTQIKQMTATGRRFITVIFATPAQLEEWLTDSARVSITSTVAGSFQEAIPPHMYQAHGQALEAVANDPSLVALILATGDAQNAFVWAVAVAKQPRVPMKKGRLADA
jgi:hypothetical protein